MGLTSMTLMADPNNPDGLDPNAADGLDPNGRPQ